MRNKFKLLIILVTIIFILPLAMPVFAASSGVTVTSSVGYYPNGNTPMSRLSFYANTKLWDFYFANSSVYFKTSNDNGSTWSGATELDMEADISLTPSSYNGYFAVWSDGTHAHFAVTDDGEWHTGGGLWYRMATINSNGTLSYVDDWQVIDHWNDGAYGGYNINICTDSNGYPWIAIYDDWNDSYPLVWKSSTKDGTWSTASGFPYYVENEIDVPILVPLTSGKMGVVLPSAETNKGLKYCEWSGSTWGSVSTLSTNNNGQNYYNSTSAVSYGDNIYIVYNDGQTVQYTIRISGTWTDDRLYLNPRTPTITVDSSTGNAYVFIINAGTVNHIYYKKFTASGSTWDANWTDYIDESSDGSCAHLNSPFYMKSGTDLLCFYQTGTASSANLKVSYVAASGGTYNLTNSPSSIDFGVIQPSTKYYAYGSAPSNPVTDGQCTFTITNGQANAIKVNIQATDFTGGGGWTLGTPDGTHARLIAYYSGENPASGVTLTTSPQTFVASLAGSATIKWDFSWETATAFADGTQKSSTITLTGVAP